MALIRKSTGELSIKPKLSTRARSTLTILGALTLVALLYFSYQRGKLDGNRQIEQDQATISRLNTSITDLEARLAKAQEDSIIAQRHRQIQEEAYAQINTAYASAERKNSYLSSRLDFYRSIISPEDGNSGPSIQAAELSLSGDQLTFTITLVQAIKHRDLVQGALEVVLTGAGQGEQAWPSSGASAVSYQYFEQVSGSFAVAQLSEDAKLNVKLLLQNGEIIERQFGVNAILNVAESA